MKPKKPNPPAQLAAGTIIVNWALRLSLSFQTLDWWYRYGLFCILDHQVSVGEGTSSLAGGGGCLTPSGQNGPNTGM